LLLVHPPELLILLALAGNRNSSRAFEKKKKKTINGPRSLNDYKKSVNTLSATIETLKLK